MRCRSVSSAHERHRSVGTIRILCSRSYVGTMSWIIRCHDAFVDTGAGVCHRFFYTTTQSLSGHSLSIRTPMDCASASMSVRSTSYIHTACTCLLIPPISEVQYRRCPSVAGAGIPVAQEFSLCGVILARVFCVQEESLLGFVVESRYLGLHFL